MRLTLPCAGALDCLAVRPRLLQGAASMSQQPGCGSCWPAEAVLELQAARLVLFGPSGGLLAGGAGAGPSPREVDVAHSFAICGGWLLNWLLHQHNKQDIAALANVGCTR